MNIVVQIGRVTKDVELRQTTSGKSAVEFSLAVKRDYKSANGEYESDFFNCVSFGKTAELISKYVKKGDQIAVDGKLQTRNYTNKEGRKIYVTEIRVDNVEFLQAKKQDQEATEEPKTEWEEIDPFAQPLPF
jgi:single-strand DNA-binding protein